MTIFELLALFAFLIASGTLLDKLIGDEVITSLSSRLLNADKHTFAKYVAGNSLSIFNWIFNKKFISWRFFIHSSLLTISIFALLLLYLYISFPYSFYFSTSFMRSYADNDNLWLVAAILPIVVFCCFDFICNGQTQYFLRLMKSSSGLPKFLLIGYADLVVTTSIAIMSIVIGIFIFCNIGFMKTYTLNVRMDFSKPLLTYATPTTFRYITSYQKDLKFRLKVSEFEKKILRKDVAFLLSNPTSHDGNKYIISGVDDPNPRITRIASNGAEVWTSYDPDDRSRAITIASNISDETQRSYCALIAKSIYDERFIFKIESGWDEKKISDACLKDAITSLSINYKLKNSALEYTSNATRTVSILIENMLNFLFGSSDFYTHSISSLMMPKETYGTWFNSEEKTAVAGIHSMFLHHFYVFNGEFRIVEGAGYPWSLFFIATLFTSMFIWFVIIATTLIYPALKILDLFACDALKVKVNHNPFNVISLITICYVCIINLFITI